MKITACLQESGNVRLDFEGNFGGVYASQREIDQIIDNNWKTTIIDYHIIFVTGYQMVIMESPSGYSCTHGEPFKVKAEYTIINIDTKQLFTRIKEVTAKKGIYKKVVFDTASFHRSMKRDPKANRPYMSFAAIFNHPNFFGQLALKNALKQVTKDHLFRLRELINIKLVDGFCLQTDDLSKPNFFFWGGGYNGGIIFHGEDHGYSTHT